MYSSEMEVGRVEDFAKRYGTYLITEHLPAHDSANSRENSSTWHFLS